MDKLKKRINTLLNKYGYYKATIPEGSEVNQKDIYELFKTYGGSEVFTRLLRDLCERDIKLYFQASNDLDRDRIRGAYQRTHYFISLTQKANDKRTIERNNKRRGGEPGGPGGQ